MCSSRAINQEPVINCESVSELLWISGLLREVTYSAAWHISCNKVSRSLSAGVNRISAAG